MDKISCRPVVYSANSVEFGIFIYKYAIDGSGKVSSSSLSSIYTHKRQ